MLTVATPCNTLSIPVPGTVVHNKSSSTALIWWNTHAKMALRPAEQSSRWGITHDKLSVPGTFDSIGRRGGRKSGFGKGETLFICRKDAMSREYAQFQGTTHGFDQRRDGKRLLNIQNMKAALIRVCKSKLHILA